jgi:hypothetical protein
MTAVITPAPASLDDVAEDRTVVAVRRRRWSDGDF